MSRDIKKEIIKQESIEDLQDSNSPQYIIEAPQQSTSGSQRSNATTARHGTTSNRRNVPQGPSNRHNLYQHQRQQRFQRHPRNIPTHRNDYMVRDMGIPLRDILMLEEENATHLRRVTELESDLNLTRVKLAMNQSLIDNLRAGFTRPRGRSASPDRVDDRNDYRSRPRDYNRNDRAYSTAPQLSNGLYNHGSNSNSNRPAQQPMAPLTSEQKKARDDALQSPAECFNCGKFDHTLQQCPDKCVLCNGDHTAPNCTAVQWCVCGSRKHSREHCDAFCDGRICGFETSHLATDCTHCCNCGSMHHNMLACTRPKCGCSAGNPTQHMAVSHSQSFLQESRCSDPQCDLMPCGTMAHHRQGIITRCPICHSKGHIDGCKAQLLSRAECESLGLTESCGQYYRCGEADCKNGTIYNKGGKQCSACIRRIGYWGQALSYLGRNGEA